MLKEHDRVVLTTDIPEKRLQAGDVGTIIHVYSGGEAFELEFLTLGGDTAAVATLRASQVRAVSSDEITHARKLEMPV